MSTPHPDAPSSLVADVLDYAIVGLDDAGLITSWNRGAELLKGYPPAEALGRSFALFYPEDDRAAGLPERLLAQAREHGSARHRGWRVRRDGSRFWADVVISARYDGERRPAGFVKVVRDLTEEHETRQALERSEERLRLLIEQVTDYAIISLDPDGVIESWNGGARRLKGYTAQEAIGQSLTIFYADADRRAGLPRHLLETARREGSVRHVGWRVRRDGSRFWGDVRITAVRDEQGELTGFAKVTQDLTDQHRLELAQESFLSTLAHDFKTPLTAIRGFLELARDSDPEERATWLHRADHNVGRLDAMLDDFVAFLELDRGEVPLRPDAVDLARLCRSVVHDLASIADVSRVLLPEHEVRCLGDHVALTRVVTNLVTNALRYSEVGPVVLDVGVVGQRVRLSIADHGRGVHPDDLPRIFEPHERGRLATDDGGVGLGLASVRELVVRQGGRVWMNSVLDQGTVVTVELPVAPEAAAAG